MNKREFTHLFHPSYELINPEHETQATILRIQQMEEYMDKVLNALSTCPDSIHELEEIKEMIAILTDYYDNGQWLKDYDRDSNGELPPDLKRGVLSQDALYNLLCDAKELSMV